jgi:predicted metal-dependent phosphotriesterase family hydrolase
VKELVDAGFGHRIMLSHDWSVLITISTREATAGLERYNPDGYLFISRRFLPRLREIRVDAAAIDRIMVDNPRRFFENEQ